MKNRIYMYIALAIIFLVIMSSVKQEMNDGFTNAVRFYKSDYFIIPLLATFIIIGPLIYIIYKKIIMPIQKEAGAPVT